MRTTALHQEGQMNFEVLLRARFDRLVVRLCHPKAFGGYKISAAWRRIQRRKSRACWLHASA